VSGRHVVLQLGTELYEIRVEGPDPAGAFRVSGSRNDRQGSAPLTPLSGRIVPRDGALDLVTPGGVLRCRVAREGRGVWISCRGRTAYVERQDLRRPKVAVATRDEVRAPMTGVVVEVRAEPGSRVAREHVLAVLEAMKMEYRLLSPRDGQVREVAVRPGDRVELGALVVRLEPAALEGDEAAARAPGTAETS
jgi:acetyl/propionyl-CoA carboxylase alpha subunit